MERYQKSKKRLSFKNLEVCNYVYAKDIAAYIKNTFDVDYYILTIFEELFFYFY